MVSNLDPTRNLLNGPNCEKTSITKVSKSISIIVLLMVSNHKCVYLLSYPFFLFAFKFDRLLEAIQLISCDLMFIHKI